MFRKLFLLFVVALLTTASLSAIPDYVNQIPNGQKNRCLNCHVNKYGGQKNVFGQAIKNGFLGYDGNVLWSSVLASIDFDGDGYTNGEELQDPDGTWIIGEDNPGNIDLVTLPGDGDDYPSSVFDFLSINSLDLNISVSPNPISLHTVISFDLQKMQKATIAIYDAEGNLVVQLANQTFTNGSHRVDWDATNMYGEIVPSGSYYLLITGDKYRDSHRIVVVR